jgi:hypothetical protein
MTPLVCEERTRVRICRRRYHACFTVSPSDFITAENCTAHTITEQVIADPKDGAPAYLPCLRDQRSPVDGTGAEEAAAAGGRHERLDRPAEAPFTIGFQGSLEGMLTACSGPVSPRSFRDRIYDGNVLHFTSLAPMQQIISFTRRFLEDYFHPSTPTDIHLHLTYAEQIEHTHACARDYSRLAEVKQLWRALFETLGFDPTAMARDRLRLRFQLHRASDDSTPRIPGADTIQLHRDTWGTNLYAQVNWWAPVYPISAGRTVALYPTLWSKPVANSSADFDIGAAISAHRQTSRSKPIEYVPHFTEAISGEPMVPIVIDPATIIAFSGAHAHAGVPNHTGLTRISLETRTLWIEDHLSGTGTVNIDGSAALISPGLFRRLSDGAKLEKVLDVEPYIRPH